MIDKTDMRSRVSEKKFRLRDESKYLKNNGYKKPPSPTVKNSKMSWILKVFPLIQTYQEGRAKQDLEYI